MVQVTSLPGLEFSWDGEGCCAVVSLTGEMDLANAEAVSSLLRSLADDMKSHIIIDCDSLAFIDSTGLQAILSAASDFDGIIVLAAPSPHVRKLLEVTALTDVLPSYDTVGDARAALHEEQDPALATGSA